MKVFFYEADSSLLLCLVLYVCVVDVNEEKLIYSFSCCSGHLIIVANGQQTLDWF